MRFPILLVAVALLAGCASQQATQAPAPPAAPTIQPGAPGQASRVIEGSELQSESRPWTEADVRFMQGMIGHHAQALDMTELVPDRSNHRDLNLLAQRIEISQKDEISLMQNWLRSRGQVVPEATAHHMMQGHAEPMPGMLTPDQMDQLREASGDQFRRLWVEFMIQHHDGAIIMVDALFASEGAGQEHTVFQFATEVAEDQAAEIQRMQAMLNR